MLRFGEIRIGTLFDFRGLEKDIARGDRDEGHRSRILLVEEATTRHPQLQGLVRSDGDYSVTNSIFETADKSDDYYLYCMSRTFNPSLFAEFNADVCVLINDRDIFFDAVTRAMDSRVTGERSVVKVAYTDRTTSRVLNQSQDAKDGKLIPNEYWLQVDAGVGFFTAQPVDNSALLKGTWIKHPRFRIQAEWPAPQKLIQSL